MSLTSLKNNKSIYNVFSDAYCLPKLIKVRHNLFALSFKVMKLLPAKYIIESALNRQEISHNANIVATSSGTFALGVGIVCAEKGLSFTIFGDHAIDGALYEQLKLLGGTVKLISNKLDPSKNSYQKLRLEALQQYLESQTSSFWLRQYDNLDNSKAYSIVGELIVNELGSNISLVGSVGSGGSTCGIISAIRDYDSNAELVGVDTFNSVLFGLEDGPRELRGLGNSIMPKNLKHSYYDKVHWVCANDAYHFTRSLYSQTGMFAGPSTGAAYQVANYLAAHEPNKVYVFISADEGHRYANTVYNPHWYLSQKNYSNKITEKPLKIYDLKEVCKPWSFIEWKRRSYKELIGDEVCHGY